MGIIRIKVLGSGLRDVAPFFPAASPTLSLLSYQPISIYSLLRSPQSSSSRIGAQGTDMHASHTGHSSLTLNSSVTDGLHSSISSTSRYVHPCYRPAGLLSPTWKPSTRGLRLVLSHTARDPDPPVWRPRIQGESKFITEIQIGIDPSELHSGTLRPTSPQLKLNYTGLACFKDP